MALRPAWKGTLKLNLVQVPIRVFAATTPGSDVTFHMVHRQCHSRIEVRRWCPHCRRDVDRSEVIKGYEREDGRFMLVNEEEIAALKSDSARVVDMFDVVDLADVDPLLIERAYYLAPATADDAAAFVVIRDALDGRAAVGRLTLHGREYLVAVVVRGHALMLYTLRTQSEVRAAAAIDELAYADVKAKPQDVKLARQVFDSLATDADLRRFTDRYEDSLRVMKQRAADEGPAPAVTSLTDALRRSVALDGRNLERPARVLRHPGSSPKHRAG
jgi:DNA end-binding protein Ku